MHPAAMNKLQLVLLVAAAFQASASAGSADTSPRPTNKEWKEKRAKEDAKAAEPLKMAAVNKAVTLLEKLQQKVMEEGQAEAKTYDTFACWCKDGQREKTKANKENKDQKDSLTAAINKLATGRKADDKTISELEDDIKDLDKDMEDEEKDNAKEVKKYLEKAADLSDAIDSIEGALKALKSSQPSLLQLRSASNAVQTALAMADALGLGVDTMHGPAAAFLQGEPDEEMEAPDVEMENYKSHSGGVIDTIEGLLKKFRGKKEKVDEEEVTRVQEHDMKIQKFTDDLAAKNVELRDTQKARDKKTEEISEKNQELTTVSSTLLDDQEYLNNLYSMCSKRAKTWDQRTKVRADELSAITAAITLVKGAVAEKTSVATVRFLQRGISVRLTEAMVHNEDAMDAVEAAAEEKEAQLGHPLAFLQQNSVAQYQHPSDYEMTRRVSETLLSTGSRVGSTLLTSLAATITTGKPKGMEKVKGLIEALIKRLKAEAASEATQKGFCDKSIAKANTKRVELQGNVDELNDNMANLEADRILLKEQLDKLKDEIDNLDDAQKDADKLRKDEKKENKETISEAKEGKSIVASAITLLEDFYKSAAKEKVSFVQGGPEDDAPDAGFEADEAYKGSQSGGGSVLAMLDIIKSDFARTIKVTEQAEDEAEQDHKAFTEETTTSLKAKKAAVKAKKKEKSGLDSDFDADKESLGKNTDLLVGKIEELLELKKTCVDSGMSYEDRVARREEEIAALRKALCILSNYALNGANDGEVSLC